MIGAPVARTRKGLRYLAGRHRPEIGCTPKDVVWRRDKAELWRYRSTVRRYGPPIVIVHSLVSRSSILDLRPGASMVQALCDAGFDVFLVDWGVPDELDADNTLETYVDEYLPLALEAARAASGADDVTLAGYCLGGILALLYVAGRPDHGVRNLITVATPVDMSAMGAMVALIREGRLDAEDLIDETGNVAPSTLLGGFRMLVPTDRVMQYVNLWQHLTDDSYVDAHQAVAAWAHDHIPFPGATFGQVVEQLVRDNALMRGTMVLGGRRIDLADVRCRMLVVLAEYDTVVPPAAGAPLVGLVGSDDVEQLRLAAGHIALAVGRQAATATIPRLVEWLVRVSDDERPPRPALAIIS
jgi:polyhydroxyalkanoate synthase